MDNTMKTRLEALLRQARLLIPSSEIDPSLALQPLFTNICQLGCDRSTPNLRRLLPTLIAFGHIRLGDGHRLRSQVPLMDIMPDTT